MDKKRLIIYPLLLIIAIAIASQGFTRFGLNSLIYPLIVTFAYFYALFIVATIIKNNSIVDIHWGMGFVVGAWTSFLIRDEPTLLSYFVLCFITLWGLRLSIRLYRRNHGKPEDFRYAQWREEWGDKVVITAFLRVFTVQAIINFATGSVAYAIILYNGFEFAGIGQVLVYIGLAISLTGLFFEVVGDEQLRRHIKKGTRTLMQNGLWSVTRHPNYFGEILIWIGLYLAGISMLVKGNINLIYYIGLMISPLSMTIVLTKISTPLLEKNMTKYDGWEAYTKRVPELFPWGKKG